MVLEDVAGVTDATVAWRGGGGNGCCGGGDWGRDGSGPEGGGDVVAGVERRWILNRYESWIVRRRSCSSSEELASMTLDSKVTARR